PTRSPSRSRWNRFRDRKSDDDAGQQARREDVEQGGVAEAGHDRTGDAESNHDSEGERHAVQRHGAALPLLGRGVRDEGHRTRTDEYAPDAVAHADEGEEARGRRERIDEE